MLQQNYISEVECCGYDKTKWQLRKITINSLFQKGEHDPKLTQLYADTSATMLKAEGIILKKGRWYQTRDTYHWAIWPCPCPIPGFEVQMDGEIISETELPMCPCEICLGPFFVKHKGDKPLGELDPHYYILQGCFWSWFHPCCMTLDVKDQGLNHIYTIERVPFTCCCCTEWIIYDKSHQMKGNFQTGAWCYPHIEINLPFDTEENKRLLLGSFGVLP